MLQKPYNKKLETVENFTIWDVDGHYIRDNINREFTNFGQHYRFPFIPKHEFWIDHESSPGELDYFINHLLIEWYMMAKGIDFDTAISAGDAIEIQERKKSAQAIKAVKEIHKTHAIPKELYKEKLHGYCKNLDIWVVSGELVRDLYFIDYTEGGHHYVYDWVPMNEVWIDDDLTPAERPYVILHELHERHLMSKGFNYSKAHYSSSAIEYHCRLNPKDLDKYIEKEIELNKD